MALKGLQINDAMGRVVSVQLMDILKEIRGGEQLFWSILYLRCVANTSEVDVLPCNSIPIFEKQIDESPYGYFIAWDKLLELADMMFQIYDLDLIGCTKESLLRKYEQDLEMNEQCHFVIKMVDSSFWEIFSHDEQFLSRLHSKFKNVVWLDSN